MRLHEFASDSVSKLSQSPDEQRIKSLRANKERADKALKAERERQKLQKAQSALKKLRLSPL